MERRQRPGGLDLAGRGVLLLEDERVCDEHGLGLPDFFTLGVDLRRWLLLVSEQAGQEMVDDVRNRLPATADFLASRARLMYRWA